MDAAFREIVDIGLVKFRNPKVHWERQKSRTNLRHAATNISHLFPAAPTKPFPFYVECPPAGPGAGCSSSQAFPFPLTNTYSATRKPSLETMRGMDALNRHPSVLFRREFDGFKKTFFYYPTVAFHWENETVYDSPSNP
ncbi:unnamed protein product [Bursaphelenchus xylophilus]|uniref:(pine wood nematode) hypothetical protein n=1 Tax=Bursaphelenchus xylophilus TaxID=6326 RepID=A0A1I7STJ5_BURXY|nr:unnamed protein product [Bursaphelenchus xylophilus]CAG9108331.1 unnamed protein product [Bursaphelenchus xylophilus]